MIKKWAIHLLFSALVLLGLSGGAAYSPQHAEGVARYDDVLYFPASRYPETDAHISDAIKAGHSDVCTIERSGADKRRQESLKGIPTKPGFDRDEWPMAMCEEGGKGASVRYVSSSDNRGAGSWVGNRLSDYADGTRILFIVR
ncbi:MULTISPECIES: NucA/NucB deoxyribonuclease domain-containing protein [Bacillus]|uniref:NucA/NucB deoxyribonuclease domain-containing protein n=1 Tax=Bacillus TaxID=1386 RepID=UPI0022AA621B|nr:MULTISPECIES: NucA/NucB deoxyribonuclease domain-containing protein [Bacillus]